MYLHFLDWKQIKHIQINIFKVKMDSLKFYNKLYKLYTYNLIVSFFASPRATVSITL